MIEVFLPSKRKKQTYVETLPWTPITDKDSDKNTAFVFEKLRRDKLVRAAFAKCQWKVGDTVSPYSQEERTKWGECCVITGIARNLIEYGDDWPESDNPLIVSCHIENTNKNFFCTPEYLIKYETEKQT